MKRRTTPACPALSIASMIVALLVALPTAASFTRRSGAPWIERRGGPVGAFRALHGAGIPVEPAAMTDPDVAFAAAERFWSDNADLLSDGVLPGDLSFAATSVFRGVRIVRLAQTIEGLEVLGASATVAMVNGRIVLVLSRTFPWQPVDPHPSVPSALVRRSAVLALGTRGVAALAGEPRLAILPLAGDDTLDLRAAFEVKLDAGVAGRFTAF
ncbi:MAG: hypothetical protein PHU25_20720, partial [Deltaproteobacteria bacterium]|nr:hypothetical protein [Deltaproteobacteria bacterium]